VFSPEQLRLSQENLLLANVVPVNDVARTFFSWLHNHPVQIPTFAILPADSGEAIDLLPAAISAVDDFVLWPPNPKELVHRLMRLLGPVQHSQGDVEHRLFEEMALRRLVGRDPAFLHVMERLQRFRAAEAPVLVTGETGTGKELCARAIHSLSARLNGPFIPVDCGSIPEHLFENELFGHAKGAFTDARTDRKGLVALAHGGTLFLDELDALSPAAQAKVLRLLQESTYRPLGAERFCHADVRIIAATNSDLEARVRERHFRQDLYFRVAVLRVHLPALRDRGRDIPLLARHFAQEMCQGLSVPGKVLSAAALAKLQRHDWPGNVRELHNAVQRAVLSAPGPQIGAAHVDLGSAPDENNPREDFRSAKHLAINRFERDYVERLLHKHAGNITSAAREAGKDRRAFGRLVKKYGLSRGAPIPGRF
jgi:DNA-binding NtrC family response regulator